MERLMWEVGCWMRDVGNGKLDEGSWMREVRCGKWDVES